MLETYGNALFILLRSLIKAILLWALTILICKMYQRLREMAGSSSWKSHHRAVSDFFIEVLSTKKEPVYYDLLRGHLAQAPESVRQFVQKFCKGEELLLFFKKRKNYFSVDYHECVKLNPIPMWPNRKGEGRDSTEKNTNIVSKNDGSTDIVQCQKEAVAVSEVANACTKQEVVSKEEELDFEEDAVQYFKGVLKNYRGPLCYRDMLYERLPKYVKAHLKKKYPTDKVQRFLLDHCNIFKIDEDGLVTLCNPERRDSVSSTSEENKVENFCSSPHKMKPKRKKQRDAEMQNSVQHFFDAEVSAIEFFVKIFKYNSNAQMDVMSLHNDLSNSSYKVQLFIKSNFQDKEFYKFFTNYPKVFCLFENTVTLTSNYEDQLNTIKASRIDSYDGNVSDSSRSSDYSQMSWEAQDNLFMPHDLCSGISGEGGKHLTLCNDNSSFEGTEETWYSVSSDSEVVHSKVNKKDIDKSDIPPSSLTLYDVVKSHREELTKAENFQSVITKEYYKIGELYEKNDTYSFNENAVPKENSVIEKSIDNLVGNVNASVKNAAISRVDSNSPVVSGTARNAVSLQFSDVPFLSNNSNNVGFSEKGNGSEVAGQQKEEGSGYSQVDAKGTDVTQPMTLNSSDEQEESVVQSASNLIELGIKRKPEKSMASIPLTSTELCNLTRRETEETGGEKRGSRSHDDLAISSSEKTIDELSILPSENEVTDSEKCKITTPYLCDFPERIKFKIAKFIWTFELFCLEYLEVHVFNMNLEASVVDLFSREIESSKSYGSSSVHRDVLKGKLDQFPLDVRTYINSKYDGAKFINFFKKHHEFRVLDDLISLAECTVISESKDDPVLSNLSQKVDNNLKTLYLSYYFIETCCHAFQTISVIVDFLKKEKCVRFQQLTDLFNLFTNEGKELVKNCKGDSLNEKMKAFLCLFRKLFKAKGKVALRSLASEIHKALGENLILWKQFVLQLHSKDNLSVMCYSDSLEKYISEIAKIDSKVLDRYQDMFLQGHEYIQYLNVIFSENIRGLDCNYMETYEKEIASVVVEVLQESGGVVMYSELPSLLFTKNLKMPRIMCRYRVSLLLNVLQTKSIFHCKNGRLYLKQSLSQGNSYSENATLINCSANEPQPHLHDDIVISFNCEIMPSVSTQKDFACDVRTLTSESCDNISSDHLGKTHETDMVDTKDFGIGVIQSLLSENENQVELIPHTREPNSAFEKNKGSSFGDKELCGQHLAASLSSVINLPVSSSSKVFERGYNVPPIESLVRNNHEEVINSIEIEEVSQELCPNSHVSTYDAVIIDVKERQTDSVKSKIGINVSEDKNETNPICNEALYGEDQGNAPIITSGKVVSGSSGVSKIESTPIQNSLQERSIVDLNLLESFLSTDGLLRDVEFGCEKSTSLETHKSKHCLNSTACDSCNEGIQIDDSDLKIVFEGIKSLETELEKLKVNSKYLKEETPVGAVGFTVSKMPHDSTFWYTVIYDRENLNSHDKTILFYPSSLARFICMCKIAEESESKCLKDVMFMKNLAVNNNIVKLHGIDDECSFASPTVLNCDVVKEKGRTVSDKVSSIAMLAENEMVTDLSQTRSETKESMQDGACVDPISDAIQNDQGVRGKETHTQSVGVKSDQLNEEHCGKSFRAVSVDPYKSNKPAEQYPVISDSNKDREFLENLLCSYIEELDSAEISMQMPTRDTASVNYAKIREDVRVGTGPVVDSSALTCTVVADSTSQAAEIETNNIPLNELSESVYDLNFSLLKSNKFNDDVNANKGSQLNETQTGGISCAEDAGTNKNVPLNAFVEPVLVSNSLLSTLNDVKNIADSNKSSELNETEAGDVSHAVETVTNENVSLKPCVESALVSNTSLSISNSVNGIANENNINELDDTQTDDGVNHAVDTETSKNVPLNAFAESALICNSSLSMSSDVDDITNRASKFDETNKAQIAISNSVGAECVMNSDVDGDFGMNTVHRFNKSVDGYEDTYYNPVVSTGYSTHSGRVEEFQGNFGYHVAHENLVIAEPAYSNENKDNLYLRTTFSEPEIVDESFITAPDSHIENEMLLYGQQTVENCFINSGGHYADNSLVGVPLYYNASVKYTQFPAGTISLKGGVDQERAEGLIPGNAVADPNNHIMLENEGVYLPQEMSHVVNSSVQVVQNIPFANAVSNESSEFLRSDDSLFSVIGTVENEPFRDYQIAQNSGETEEPKGQPVGIMSWRSSITKVEDMSKLPETSIHMVDIHAKEDYACKTKKSGKRFTEDTPTEIRGCVLHRREHSRKHPSNSKEDDISEFCANECAFLGHIILIDRNMCLAEIDLDGKKTVVYCLGKLFKCLKHADCKENFTSLTVGDAVWCYIISPSKEDVLLTAFSFTTVEFEEGEASHFPQPVCALPSTESSSAVCSKTNGKSGAAEFHNESSDVFPEQFSSRKLQVPREMPNISCKYDDDGGLPTNDIGIQVCTESVESFAQTFSTGPVKYLDYLPYI